MALDVKCKIRKQVFVNYLDEFRILGCKPIGNYNMELDKWGGFSISGSNLFGFKEGDEVEITIRPNQNAKRPASYILVGYPGLKMEKDEIVVEEEKEISILSTMMEYIQAERVHEAYPHFVQMVLRGEEENIDYHNIYNVGKVRVEMYIDKIKKNLESILFFPVCAELGITQDKDVQKLSDKYASPELLQQDFEENPYRIYHDVINWSFAKSDREVLKRYPDLKNSKLRCEYGCVNILHENELEGDTRIEAEVLGYMAEEMIPECKEHIPEVVNGCRFIHHDEATGYSALIDTYEAEETIAKHIKDRLLQGNIFETEYTMSKPDFEKFREVDGFKCTDEQMQVLYNTWEQNICVLRGYSGSGKSASTKALVRMLEDMCVDYMLLAPTGIASKVLANSTGRKASTIHRFLAQHSMDEQEGQCMQYRGVIIVDESSMVSVHLMAQLLKKVGYKCKLVFVCDPAQLASIQCGNFIVDVINSGIVPVASLNKIFRYSTSGLITIATDTRNGNIDHVTEKYDDYEFEPISNPIKQVMTEYQHLLDEGYTKDDIMILSPFNKGEAGSVAINRAIQAHFNDKDYTPVEYEDNNKGGKIQFKWGDKVLNTKNNYRMTAVALNDEGSFSPSFPIEVMNGDIGYVREVMETDKGYALVVEFENGYGVYEGADLRNLILGYCISTHKSQGSSAKAVIFLADQSHKRLLSRNLCYVAMTRSRDKLVVISDTDVLRDALEVQEETTRDTWLKDMLKENVKEEYNSL